MQWNSDGYGAVRIVPAADLRNISHQQSTSSRQQQQSKRLSTQSAKTEPAGGVSFQSNPSEVPINYAYYPSQISGSSGYVRNYSAHAYHGNTLDHPNNTLNPTLRKYQRIRTTANKTAPVHTSYQRYRGSRTDPPPDQPVDSRYYRSYSGPIKRPPLYQKRREPRPYAENYGTDPFAQYYAHQLYDFPSVSQLPPPQTHSLSRHPATVGSYETYGRIVPIQKPFPINYATVKQQKKLNEKRRKSEERQFIESAYPVYARLGIKLAEFVFGLIAIGLILAPIRSLDLADFFRRTQTEFQGLVLAVLASLTSLTFLLLISVYCANTRSLWRRFDIVNTAVSSFLYLVVTCIEAYYAACYPPNGAKIGLIICFCQIVLYITDLIMALRTGVSLL
ncbi:hypothetical protein M3Y96_01223200 [Aphelenchoides besseyi]|nr:hypothetical protein M3Y96_01223200 [Aphelenchoides besseyi]